MLPPQGLNAGETGQWVLPVPPMAAGGPSEFICCQAHAAHGGLLGWRPGSPASAASLV